MKNQKLKKLIQKPLRFHHQDIHEELNELKSLISNLTYQVIELKKEINHSKDTIKFKKGCAKCETGTVDLTPN